MEFNLKQVPFSRYGSYFTIGYPRPGRGKEGLYIRTVRGNVRESEIFQIKLTYQGEPIPFDVKATPTHLELKSAKGSVHMCIAQPQLIRFKGEGVGVRLFAETASYDYAIPYDGDRWMANCNKQQLKFMFIPLVGQLKVDAPWKVLSSEYIVADFIPDQQNQQLEFAIEEFFVSYDRKEYTKDFDECIREIEEEYSQWINNVVRVKQQYKDAGELAAYIDWSCFVEPSGHIKRPAMYMSKNWMGNIWSWDNLFNAMALVAGETELAWDQMVFFDDFQDESGMYPDLVNDRNILWNFCKPPIQGWTLDWMMKRGYFTDNQRLEQIYPSMVRWTNWWFKYSDSDQDGIPQYNHGNESGWDNSTIFHDESPVESPDLSAFLVIQMDVLSNIAMKLGKGDEAKEWKDRADDLLKKMLDHFWLGDRFVARISGTHRCIDTQSLQLFIPIVLGNRLPKNILDTLLKGLKDQERFLTPHGFATESINSSYYQPDGYWRGPIWPPTSMIFIDSLHKIGEEEFARDMAIRYCNMAAKSGMAENYDAVTGQGLRDRAHTWGASVFLVLASEYC